MGKKKKDDEDDWIPLPDDYPPPPPPMPEGGWTYASRAKVENLHDPPKGGWNPPIPDDPVDIRRMDLRVGKVTFAMKHPIDPESLMLTYVDIGDPFPRPIISNIGKFYTKEELEDRMVVALCNMPPVRHRPNIANTAMLMCGAATTEDGTVRHELWRPPPRAVEGEDVHAENYPMMPQLHSSPLLPYLPRTEPMYQDIAADLRINAEREVVYKESNRLFVKKRKGFVTLDTMTDCPIKTDQI